MLPLLLIAALGDVAIGAGIESIVGNFNSTMLRLYRRIGCEVEVLGSTQRYGRPVYLGLFPISEPILAQSKGEAEEGAISDRRVDGEATIGRLGCLDRNSSQGAY